MLQICPVSLFFLVKVHFVTTANKESGKLNGFPSSGIIFYLFSVYTREVSDQQGRQQWQETR